MDQIQTRFAKYSSNSYAAERQQAPGAASCFFEDLQSLRVDFDPPRGVKFQGLHLHQVQVGSKVNQEVDECRLTAMPQDSVHHTHR